MAEHICPIWVGYLLASPVRKLWHSPQKILRPFIKDGDIVMDVGCAMGFFSLPMAQMVGERGKVICLDVQEKMLGKLQRHAEKLEIYRRISLRLANSNGLNIQDLQESIDFILAFSVVHEVPDQTVFFRELFDALKDGGYMLVSEPKGHVSQVNFARTIMTAKNCGLKVREDVIIPKSRAALLEK
ncbi:class I SAM-dependent methyltransferase [candidate division KSB1 bacterium]|nr:class I SAM-dependent methyltransferase [candidate division KSB1 bacterium]RQW05224.1 MAG: class I SAM-dependent methyltransferase [candidate division KSB1 bacterium]